MMKLKNLYNEEMNAKLNCTWMISNMVGIKLCDKKFECETCPLDIIMRNINGDGSNTRRKSLELNDTSFIDRIINGMNAADYQANLIYLKNNWIVKHLYANIYYMGINPVITPILDDLISIQEYMKKIYFTKDQKLLVLEGDWGKLPLSVPMNFLLLDKLNWSPEEINANKWIALIAANQNEIQDAEISVDQWKTDKANLINLLSEYKENCQIISWHKEDKGETINKFYQLVGCIEYTKLLNSIFNV